ncbi:MAG: J domain-containing protein [Xanthobacteraceae bacterium]
MPELGGDSFSIAFANAVLLAAWPVLPLLLLGYTRESLLARRIRLEFSLRRFESIELDRAIRLHNRLSQRLTELKEGDQHRFSWRIVLKRHPESREQHADELEDLKAHAQHLRTTIGRLSRQPLQRLRSWLRIKSLQFAFGGAVRTHLVSLTLLLFIAFRFFDQSAFANEFNASMSNVLVWYPLDDRLFYANAVASGFAALAAPAFYMMRWASLRHQYSLEFCILQDFARAVPMQSIDQPPGEEDSQLRQAGINDTHNCFAVLGISESATIEEVRLAYKALIKQNHPDRLHNMSPALRELAESQTKMINAAYQQAVSSIPLQ